MEVIMMLTYDQPGVMQRVMAEFTKRKINVDTIVVGPCETPERSRIVISLRDYDAAMGVIEHLRALQEVIEADMVDHRRHEGYAITLSKGGVCRITGSVEEVEALIKRSEPDKYIEVVNAI
ncbi:MAG: acetolactate synthase [Methanobacteriota archaeon]|nr:MAG: acetolactate synthase [Euryarchaeota archaeon]